MLLRCAFLFPSQYTTFKIQIRAIYRPICRFFVYFFSYNRRWQPAVPSLNGDPAAHNSNLALLPSLLCSQHIIKYIFSPMSRCIHNGTRGQIVRHLPGGSSDLIYRSFCPLGRRWQTSQLLDFVGNHSHGLFVGVNFNRVEYVIHRYSCYTSFDYILNTNTTFHILS